MMKNTIAALGLLLCAVAQAMAGEPFRADSFFRLRQAERQEKLYLTLSQPYYEAGDTLWLRGTLVGADDLSYLVKSNYIYVELLNAAGGIVKRMKVLRDNLCFHHGLPLPSGLATGEYTLRAYTSWQRNFDEALFFARKVTILNPKEPAPAGGAEVAERDFAVTFHPEGGARLAGVEQRIAFKAVGSDGLPVEVEGEIVDRHGAPVAALRSTHDGMGAVTLLASHNVDSLTARLRVRDYADRYGMPFGRTFALPEAHAEALALQADVRGDTLRWRILAAAGRPVAGDTVRLVLHSGTRLVAEERLALGVPDGQGVSASGSLPLAGCRDGIAHLVLATDDGIGRSRRLIFYYDKERAPQGRIVRTDGDGRTARALQTYEVRLADAAGRSLRGDFAISVLDPGMVNVEADTLRDDIVSNLLLTSDLRGYVHRPAWYFLPGATPSEATARAEALDLVMLTHGWCRFATDTLRPQERDYPHPLEEREWLSGWVRELSAKDRGRTIPISVVDTAGRSYGTGRLDSLGRFFIGNLNYPDDARLQVRVLTYGKRPRFFFDPPTFPAPVHREPFRMDFARHLADTTNLRAYLLDRTGLATRLLENVEVTETRRALRDSGHVVFRETKGYQHIHDNYDLYVYHRGLGLVNEIIRNEWTRHLEEIDPFAEMGEEFAFPTKGVITNPGSDSEDRPLPSLILDRPLPSRILDRPLGESWERSYAPSVSIVDGEGKQKDGIRMLELVHSEDVDSVVCTVGIITNPKAAGRWRKVTVYLKPGVTLNEKIPDRRRTAHYTFGYTPPVEFYDPVYETEEQRSWPVPDLRRTLRWLPSLQTDGQGEMTFQFYDSDHPGPRRVVVEGVTFDGRPVRVAQTVE